MNAIEYLELCKQGKDPFKFKDKSLETEEDKMFEQLGELVEQHPVGRQ